MDERYPIGEFNCAEQISVDDVENWIDEIRLMPVSLIEVVNNLSEESLEYTYREGGWTIRQIVHHIADSHLNAYTRIKLAITEENPIIKPYAEEKWAELPDSKLPISTSLRIIDALHMRWVYLLENLTDEQLKRTFTHPVSGIVTVEKSIGMYAWHGNHHLAHLKNALKKGVR